MKKLTTKQLATVVGGPDLDVKPPRRKLTNTQLATIVGGPTIHVKP